jgi:hypothetical protein
MAGQLIWRPGQFLVKQYTGPSLKLADRVTNIDVWRGPIALCWSNALLRGTYGIGDRGGWVVTSSDVKWEKMSIGTLTINWEVGGPFAPAYLLPLDDWREETVELYPKVERNKHMYGVSYPGNPGDVIAQDTVALCYQAVHGATAQARADARTQVLGMASRSSAPPTGSAWGDQADWAIVLLSWLQAGHETYYLAGVKTTYIRHYFTQPMTTLGGFIQAPLWGPRAGDIMLSWLRLADALEPVGVNGSVYKVTSTWLGGPGGHWDPVLYAP